MSPDLNSLCQIPCVFHPLFYESESVPAWSLSCECVPVSVCVCLFYASVYKNRGFCSEFLEQYRKHHMGEGIGNFMEIFSRVLQGTMSLQLTRQHCYQPASIIVDSSLYVVDFRKLLSTSVYWVFSKWYTQAQVRGICLGCKSWLQGNPRQLVWVLLLKAG